MALTRNFWAGLVLAAVVFACHPAQAAGMRVIRDEEIERALKVMSKPIFEQAGVSADSVRFILIDNSELNAFVAGGQNIFLHTGLLLAAENPAELIGVIAHETGHIAGGHLMRGQAEASSMSMQSVLTTLAGVAVAIGARSPDAGMAIGSMGRSVALRDFLRHTRTQEGSADQAGVRFLEDSNLPVTGFLSFMKKLESQELLPESQQSQYVQTHPLTQDRIDFLQHVVSERPGGSVPADWNEVLRRIKVKLMGYLFPDRMLLLAQDTSVAGRYGRAIALFRKGQLEKATALVDDLLKEEPKNPFFHELKGQMLLDGGMIEPAVAAYARAVESAPYSGLIRVAYAHSLLESKIKPKDRREEAIRQLTIAANKEPHMAEPHYLLAIAYGKLGREGLSRLHLAEQALLQNKPDFAKREAMLAKANLKKGTPAYLRADDILDIAGKDADKAKKRD